MRYPSTSNWRKLGSYSGEVAFEATAKYGSPVASDTVFCHTTVTWLSPGTRKNCGASGANGNRNLLSNIAWATSALFSSERGAVVTSFCWMMLSGRPWPAGHLPFTRATLQPPPVSAWATQPMTRSIPLTLDGLAKIESPVAGVPGGLSPPGPPPGKASSGTASGAACTYATTIVRASPAGKLNGPEASKNRAAQVLHPDESRGRVKRRAEDVGRELPARIGQEVTGVLETHVERQHRRAVVGAEVRHVGIHRERRVHRGDGVAGVRNLQAGEFLLVQQLKLVADRPDLRLQRGVDGRVVVFPRRRLGGDVIEREDEVDDVFVARWEIPGQGALIERDPHRVGAAAQERGVAFPLPHPRIALRRRLTTDEHAGEQRRVADDRTIGPLRHVLGA